MAVTTAAIIGAATTVATTSASFAQAGRQRRLQRKAQSEAETAMEEAKKQLGVNYYEELGINKEVYETEREAQLVAAAQALEAARESDRGAEATAGRVMLAEQEAQKDITKRMNEEIQAINAAIAGEESRLRDVGVQLNLEEVAGAQLAAAQADEMAGRATQRALQGITSLGQQAEKMVPLFKQTGTSVQFPKAGPQQGMIGPAPEGYTGPAATPLKSGAVPSLPPGFGVTAPYNPLTDFGKMVAMSNQSPLQGISPFAPAQPLYDWSKILGYR